ncbi:MAG: YbaB/EbfC family nucleoid-associated protein [Bacteroidota bacterium]
MFDLFGMMDKISKLKEAVEDVRNQCDRIHVTQRSENGEVEVVCTANKKIVSIKTLPEYLNPANANALDTLLATTVDAALREAHRTHKELFKKSTEGLIPNIPGLDLSKFLS